MLARSTAPLAAVIASAAVLSIAIASASAASPTAPATASAPTTHAMQVPVSADTYVSQVSARATHGGLDHMLTCPSTCATNAGTKRDNARRAMLRLTVPALPATASHVHVTLRLTPVYPQAGRIGLYTLHAGWTEKGASWHNRPRRASHPFATISLPRSTAPVSLDLSNAARSGKTLDVAIVQTTGRQLDFFSRTAARGRPTVVITYDTPAPPKAAAGSSSVQAPTASPSSPSTSPTTGASSPTATPSSPDSSSATPTDPGPTTSSTPPSDGATGSTTPTDDPSTPPSGQESATSTAADPAPNPSSTNPSSTSAQPVQSGGCDPLPTTLPVAEMRASKKKIFAYYFPPFPVSIENKPGTSDSYSRWMDSLNSYNNYDLRDRPIPRPTVGGAWRQQDFETEIRRAMLVGIDGFIWESNGSSDPRWQQLPAMLAAAHAVSPYFKIMLSPDFPVGSGASPSSVIDRVSGFAADPAIYRTEDGRVVLAPFYPERNSVAFWDSIVSGLAANGVPAAMMPIFLSWGGGAEKSEWTGHAWGYSTWGTRTPGGVATYRKDAASAHARGAIWMQPVAFEDSRPKDGRYWESGGSQLMRDSLQTAIDSGADMIALMTWNDYTESWMSPSLERGYAVGDVASYWFDWFKTGTQPAVDRDDLYWFHRSQSTTLVPSELPIGIKGQPIGQTLTGGSVENDVELVAFLTKPGTLIIRQGDDVRSMEAPAGVTSFKVPLVAGTTPSFALARDDHTVTQLQSNTPIATSIQFQDLIYHAGGGISCPRP